MEGILYEVVAIEFDKNNRDEALNKSEVIVKDIADLKIAMAYQNMAIKTINEDGSLKYKYVEIRNQEDHVVIAYTNDAIDINIDDKVELKLTGYKVRGVSKVVDWYDNLGTIQMTPVNFDRLPAEKEIEEKLNDGGFGVQKIIGADVDVYAVYGYGAYEVLLLSTTIVK